MLTAFQQVEDNLADLRILSTEIQQEDAAVQTAQRNLALAMDRYRLAIDPYLNVIRAQTTLLTSQQVAVNLRLQQMTAHEQLTEVLGAAGIPRSCHPLAASPFINLHLIVLPACGAGSSTTIVADCNCTARENRVGAG